MTKHISVKDRDRFWFDTFLGGKKNVKIANNTWLLRSLAIHLRYHSTIVVTWNTDGSLTLNSGGWRTSTTKERINWCLPSGWYLYQKCGKWFLRRSTVGNPVDIEFYDGIVINQHHPCWTDDQPLAAPTLFDLKEYQA